MAITYIHFTNAESVAQSGEAKQVLVQKWNALGRS